MKFTFSLALLALVLTVAVANPIEKLKKAREGCNADPALKVDLARKLKAGTATDEDKHEIGKHDLCVNVHLGIQKLNGDIEIDTIRKSLESENVHKTKIDQVLAACGTRPAGSSAERAALALANCMYENMSERRE